MNNKDGINKQKTFTHLRFLYPPCLSSVFCTFTFIFIARIIQDQIVAIKQWTKSERVRLVQILRAMKKVTTTNKKGEYSQNQFARKSKVRVGKSLNHRLNTLWHKRAINKLPKRSRASRETEPGNLTGSEADEQQVSECATWCNCF